MLEHEAKAFKKGFRIIIGIDEAGRGPLAGPVVASAVFLKKKKFRSHIRDSKKIAPRERERAFLEIMDNAYVGIGIVNETVIDEINILKATHEAMSRAVIHLLAKLPAAELKRKDFKKKVCLLIDGNSFKSELPFNFETIVKGDDLSLSIACASIVAKVTRDRMLKIYDRIYPQYGFKEHKGYPTVSHKKAILKHGLSPIHRKTFRSAL